MASDPIATVAVFLGIYVAIQLFTTYLKRRFGNAGPSKPEPRSDYDTPLKGFSNRNRATESRPTVPEDAVRCPACGSPNDPSFSFCRNCIANLDGGSVGSSLSRVS